MSCTTTLRCLIPRFALYSWRSPAFTVPVFQNKHARNGCLKRFCSTAPKAKKETVTVYFNDAEGKKMAAKARVGDSLLDVVVDNDLDIDGYGACEGTLACSTCHLIFKKEDYDKLPDEPCDEELDMLDLAYGLTDTSRLGCQISVTKDMEGLEVKVPAGVADAREPS